ncbi:hypothetical protein AAFG07_24450 [Bradyrhizobium sp. B097]|uniref:hypothetical protein n=1 Tax=Bradyrhizobium sp. B097 TaxID=3140244 RepID=UPI003183852F
MVTRRCKRDVCWFTAAAMVVIGAVCSPAFADKTVYYTDSCVERESGDIGGYIVIVSDGKPFPVIRLSWSEGALKQPVAAKVTNYDRGSGQLSFSVSIEWDQGITRDIQFDGKVTIDRMTGTLAVPWETARKAIELKVRSRKAAFEPTTTCRSG